MLAPFIVNKGGNEGASSDNLGDKVGVGFVACPIGVSNNVGVGLGDNGDVVPFDFINVVVFDGCASEGERHNGAGPEAFWVPTRVQQEDFSKEVAFFDCLGFVWNVFVVGAVPVPMPRGFNGLFALRAGVLSGVSGVTPGVGPSSADEGSFKGGG